MEVLDPRIYPIGKFTKPDTIGSAERAAHIGRIASLPERLRHASALLSDIQLSKSYRADGWSAQQIFHHLVDSHINMYIRLKFALTTDEPTIMPYDENKWAEVGDASSKNVANALALLEALHIKTIAVLASMSESEYSRCYIHPQYGQRFSIDQMLALYAWHGDHHLGQIMVVAND